MNVILSPEAELFLLASHQMGRVLPQELREQLPWADEVEISVEPFQIGGYQVMCMAFLLKKAGYTDLTAIINIEQIMSRHPQSHEPLFRGKALIDSVLIPQMRNKWGITE